MSRMFRGVLAVAACIAIGGIGFAQDSAPDTFGLAPDAPVPAAQPASFRQAPAPAPAAPASRVMTLITPAQVKQALMERIPMALVDVRSELVRDVDGHIPGDVHVPFMPRQTFAARLAAAVPNSKMPIILYCHDGIWSAQAGEEAISAGYKPYLMGAYRLW